MLTLAPETSRVRQRGERVFKKEQRRLRLYCQNLGGGGRTASWGEHVGELSRKVSTDWDRKAYKHKQMPERF